MHITPPTSPSENSFAKGAAPPPPGSVGQVYAPVAPVVPNAAPAPAAVADGIFLPSSSHRATSESGDFGTVGPATALSLPPPYIPRSPMRQTPATPTRDALTSLRLGAAAARLACIEAVFRRITSAPTGPPAAVATTAAPAALRPQANLPFSSAASPGAGPSTSRPPSTPTRPLTQYPDPSALRLEQIRAALSPQPEEQTFEDGPDPFVITPGRPGNPIYVHSDTPAGTPAHVQHIAVPIQQIIPPAQQITTPAPQVNGAAANSNEPVREHATVAVQTDPVYVLSRFSTPEPFFNFNPPATSSSLTTPRSTRRSREESEVDDKHEEQPPSLRRRIEEILSSMESPPPSPPGVSNARTRVRPRGRKRSWVTKRPDEFGPAYLVKVLDSSDEEYKPYPSFPQAPSNNADATSPSPAAQSKPTISATSAVASSSAISTGMAYAGLETPGLAAFAPFRTDPHADGSDLAPSTPIASGSRFGSTSDIVDDDFPDMFDFNDAAVNAELDKVFEDAEKELEEEKRKRKGKGKAVAR